MMKWKKVIAFVIFSYAISWMIWLPNVLASHFSVPWHHSDWLHLIGGFGPFLSALLTTFILHGTAGIKNYFSEKIVSTVRLKWVLLGLGMPVLFFLVPLVFLGLFKGEWIDWRLIGMNAKIPFTNPLVIWSVWCVFYGLGEEGGWRGFLLPELAKRYTTRIASLLTGLVWALWHIPLFLYDKDFTNMGIGGTAGWLVGLAFGSILLGWLAKQSNWVLLPVILWHATFNFFTTSDKIDFLFPSTMSVLVMIFVVWILWKFNANYERKIDD